MQQPPAVLPRHWQSKEQSPRTCCSFTVLRTPFFPSQFIIYKHVRFIWSLKGSTFSQVLPYFLPYPYSSQAIVRMTSRGDQRSRQLPCSCSTCRAPTAAHTAAMLCTSENNSSTHCWTMFLTLPALLTTHSISCFQKTRYLLHNVIIHLQCSLAQSEWTRSELTCQHDVASPSTGSLLHLPNLEWQMPGNIHLYRIAEELLETR